MAASSIRLGPFVMESIGGIGGFSTKLSRPETKASNSKGVGER